MVLIISVSERGKLIYLDRVQDTGDYRNDFLFSFLIRNQLRNAVGRGRNIKFVSSFCTNIGLVPSLMDFKVRK